MKHTINSTRASNERVELFTHHAPHAGYYVAELSLWSHGISARAWRTPESNSGYDSPKLAGAVTKALAGLNSLSRLFA